MKKLLKISLPALATAFWGGAIVYLYSQGRLGEFLIPKFHTITLLGGLGMLVLSVFVLFTAKEDSDCGHDHCDHGHDHAEQNPLVLALLMIFPLGAALAADTSDGFSLELLERKGLYSNSRDNAAYALPPFTREMLEESTAQNEKGAYLLPLSQLFFSAGDETMMEVFDGLAIETEGQVVAERGGRNEQNRLRLYRTLMTCCAADAMVLGFPIEFESSPPLLEERTWVKVSGTLVYEREGDDLYPVLQVSSIQAIDAPYEGGSARQW